MNDNNYLLLREKAFNWILEGKKTSTSRLGHRDVSLGEGCIIKTEDSNCKILVTFHTIRYVHYEDIDKTEAIREGYDSLEDLQSALEKIYGKNLVGKEFTLIEFTV